MDDLLAGELRRRTIGRIGVYEGTRTAVRAGGTLTLEIATCQRQGQARAFWQREAGRAAARVGTGDQHEDREGARDHGAAVAGVAGGADD